MCEEEYPQHEPFGNHHFRPIAKFLASVLAHVEHCCAPGGEASLETKAWATNALCVLQPPKDPECLSLSPLARN